MPSNNPTILYPFGSACSEWIVPMYAALRSEFNIRILSARQFQRFKDVVEVPRTMASVLTLGNDRLLPYVSYLASRVHPRFDAIMNLKAYLCKAQIVHCVELESWTAQVAAYHKQRYSYGLVITCWENIVFRQGWRNAGQETKRVIGAADKIIAVTERAASRLVIEGVPAEKVTVIPPAIEPGIAEDIGASDAREHPSVCGRETFRFLFAGSRLRSKGMAELLAAMKLASGVATNLEFELHVAGTRVAGTQYAELADRLGVTGKIVEHGRVTYAEMGRIYGQVDCLIVPSRITDLWQEQFGMVFAEAMHHGIPIIATDSGSISEVVGDAGILCRANDHHDLSRAIVSLVNSPQLYRAKSLAGRCRAARYSVAAIAPRLSALYASILRSRESS